MTIVDLSHRLATGSAVFPGDPEIDLEPVTTIEDDGFAVTSVAMGSHSGTHVDAPSHTVANGRTVDEVAVDRLVGRAHLIRILGLHPCEPIGMDQIGAQLNALPHGARIVLIATGWDQFWDQPTYVDHPYLAAPVGEFFRDRGVDVLGMDTLNPDPTCVHGLVTLPVHDALLGADRLIIENLRGLTALPPALSSFEFSALPLSLHGSDGAPVRAIATIPAPSM